MEQIQIQKIEQLVMGEDNDYDDAINPYISNRIENKIDPTFNNLFPEDYEYSFPYIFKNYRKDNREEKIYEIIANKNASEISMIKWKHNRTDVMFEIMRKKNMDKYANMGYNLNFYLVPMNLLKRFFEKNLVTKTISNGLCPIFDYTGDLDVFAFSRENFRPKKYPFDVDGFYVFDDLDMAMLRLEERQLSLFKDSQKKALYLEYRRIRNISPRIFKEEHLALKKPFEYEKFLGLVNRILLAFGIGNSKKFAYQKFIDYFNLTKNDSSEFFSKEDLEKKKDEFIIYENMEKNKIFGCEDCEKNQKNDENLGFPISFLNLKRKKDIRIRSNCENDNNGFSISFLSKKD